jgi:hypothetical protein
MGNLRFGTIIFKIIHMLRTNKPYCVGASGIGRGERTLSWGRAQHWRKRGDGRRRCCFRPPDSALARVPNLNSIQFPKIFLARARIRHASRTPSARHCVASASTRRASGIQLRWRRSPQTPLSTATAARRSLVCATQLSYRCMPLGTRVPHCNGSDRLSGTQRV